MTQFSCVDLARSLDVDCPQGGANVVIDGVAIDSRAVTAGQLFVAIRGDTHDGHAFVAQAEQAGAAALLIDARGAASLAAGSVPRLVVADTAAALLKVGAFARAQHVGPVAGVTGSNGKTTTKELLAAALAQKGPIHKTRGNLNNHYGVPLTLAAWPEAAPAAVVEMGMSAPGEIARLCEVARPEVALVTCVAPAHLAGFGTLERVAAAKAEIYAGLQANGIAIVNDDDEPLKQAAQPVLGQRSVLRFGRGASCDVQLVAAHSRAERDAAGVWAPVLEVELLVEGHRHLGRVPVLGVHNGMNVAAAVAAAWALGVAPREALAGMATVAVPGSRAALKPLGGGRALLLDDCYNANPGSVAAALCTCGQLGRRSLAVLGDMLELGPTSSALHAATGAGAVAAGVGEVWSVGGAAESTAKGVREAGGRARAFASVEALVAALPERFGAVDAWLVKGSRGMRLERVVEALLQLDRG